MLDALFFLVQAQNRLFAHCKFCSWWLSQKKSCFSVWAPLLRCAAWGMHWSPMAFRHPCFAVWFSLHQNQLQQEMLKLPKGRRTVCHQGQSTETCGIQSSGRGIESWQLDKRILGCTWWRDSDCGMEEKEPWKVVPVVSQFLESKADLPQSRCYCPMRQQMCQGTTWHRSMHPFLAELKLRSQAPVKTICAFSREKAISTSLHQQKYFCPLW